jgi:hypothetical protein
MANPPPPNTPAVAPLPAPAPARGSYTIEPRNLTARLAFHVPGNPDTTRPEDAVGNCYPGLELDVRNLDRRFFPGLVFDFIARNDRSAPYSSPQIYGARLMYLDLQRDPDLTEGSALYAALTGKAGAALATGVWYLDWIEQRDPAGGPRPAGTTRDKFDHRLFMNRPGVEPESPMDGLFVWRLVRGLEPGEVTIGLKCRDQKADPIELTGRRRAYLDPKTGVINAAFRPGEMLQSLCSPWQHDFRDCYCHYWASNHPDVVYGEIYPGESTLPGGAAGDPERANTLIDWLREDRTRAMAAAALDSFPKNRPHQYDAYQINKTWQDLHVVIGDTEIGGLYVPPEADMANPFASPEELAAELRDKLAGLELALTCEYLYAHFSLLSPEEAADVPAWATLSCDVLFARYYLMQVASSEMQHLRWVNELLWMLYDHKLIKGKYAPVLVPAKYIPDPKHIAGAKDIADAKQTPDPPKGFRDRALRGLKPATLDDFIAVEYPSGFIDGAYARVVATLRDTKTYPVHMIETAQRIVSDGTKHFSRFQEIKAAFKLYPDAETPYLRKLREGTTQETSDAGDRLKIIIDHIRSAYEDGAQGNLARSGPEIVTARTAMNELFDIGERLAKQGLGIPFFTFLDALTVPLPDSTPGPTRQPT